MMRGIVKSGLFALLIGMTVMIAVPKDAGALTGWEQKDNFPTGLTDSSGPYGGLLNALNQSQNSRLQYFFDHLDGNTDNSSNSDENGGNDDGNGGYDDGNGGDESDGVSDVPEPATWIMMILGFGIVAWRLRRRGREGRGALPAHA